MNTSKAIFATLMLASGSAYAQEFQNAAQLNTLFHGAQGGSTVKSALAVKPGSSFAALAQETSTVVKQELPAVKRTAAFSKNVPEKYKPLVYGLCFLAGAAVAALGALYGHVIITPLLGVFGAILIATSVNFFVHLWRGKEM